MKKTFTYWHEKKIFFDLPTIEGNADGIQVTYVIENDQEFERAKSLITPWSFYCDPEKEPEFSDEEYAHHMVMMKVLDFCNRIVYEWFYWIKKNRKEIIVHLFETSPFEKSNFYSHTGSLQDPIHIFLKTSLIRALVKKDEQRIDIPEHWLLAPREDLLLGLDFKMISWRLFQPEKGKSISIDLVGHLINFRIAGLSRLINLENGVGVEGNHRLTRMELEKHYTELIELFRSQAPSIVRLKLVIHKSSNLYKYLGPRMMLHAIGVYIQKKNLKKAEKIWKDFSSKRLFIDRIDNKKLNKLHAIGRKLDVETWYQYLTEPAFDQAPLLSKKQVQDLHQIVFKRSGEPSFWGKYQRIISIHAEETFQLIKSGKSSHLDLNGIQLNPVISIPDRMRIFLEQNT